MNDVSLNVWQRALGSLQSEVDAENFAAWLAPTEFRSFEDSTLVVGVPNAVSRNWLASHYMGAIAAAVERIASKPVDILFEVADKGGAGPHPETQMLASPADEKEAYRSARLNARYSFENFVVGESNRFSCAAARAVADPEARGYNPLFIYGGVGLGKTHLMHAIGLELLGRRPNAKILYVTSEEFMNHYVESVTRSNSPAFRNYYRNVDLLLIDDVQFFIGKESTQREFFHTFNALYDAGRKIVVTSDRPPKELNHLEERLRSRFEWGLIVDIQPPDLETRMAILRCKAKMHQVDLPYEAAIYIAERIKTNVRKLEGVVLQLKARGDLSGQPIRIEDVRHFLTPFLVGEEPKKISLDRIARIVCDYFDVEIEDLRGKSRLRKHALPRHISMYLARHIGKISFPDIGRFFGSRDHSSVIHACNKIGRRVDHEINVQNLATYLTKKIQDVDS